MNGSDAVDIVAVLTRWEERLKALTPATVDDIVACYADDAVLWGTLADTRRPTREGIADYFTGLLDRLPGASVVFDDRHVQVFDDWAVASGSYTFRSVGDDGERTVPARYSFVLARRGDEWLIVHHHSSVMPAPHD